jgi:hypothetical protein
MATKQKQNGIAETAVQEIDIETAQMVIRAAKEKRVQEYLKEYETLCKKYGLQIVPNIQMGVREL